MKIPHRSALIVASLAFAGLSPFSRAQAPDAGGADKFVPPTLEVAKAAGLLPPDTEIKGKKHSLLDRWTKAFGLTEEQRLWIEPQLHNEESLTKPVLAYSALSDNDKQQILLIIKLAARHQIRALLTPSQQKLMDEDIEATKANGR